MIQIVKIFFERKKKKTSKRYSSHKYGKISYGIVKDEFSLTNCRAFVVHYFNGKIWDEVFLYSNNVRKINFQDLPKELQPIFIERLS